MTLGITNCSYCNCNPHKIRTSIIFCHFFSSWNVYNYISYFFLFYLDRHVVFCFYYRVFIIRIEMWNDEKSKKRKLEINNFLHLCSHFISGKNFIYIFPFFFFFFRMRENIFDWRIYKFLSLNLKRKWNHKIKWNRSK